MCFLLVKILLLPSKGNDYPKEENLPFYYMTIFDLNSILSDISIATPTLSYQLNGIYFSISSLSACVCP